MDKVGVKAHLTPEHLEWRWQYGKDNYHGRICNYMYSINNYCKSASLTSSITGGNYDNSYWGKNKGSSKDAVLRKITTVLGVLFIVIALLLDSKLF